MRISRAPLTNAFKTVLLLAAATPLICAAASPATITGRVVDENGAPVGKARIEVLPPAPGATAIQAESDAAGAFKLDIEDAGAYRVRVDCDGFFQFTQQSMNLTADAPVEIRINHVKEMAESVDVNYSAISFT